MSKKQEIVNALDDYVVLSPDGVAAVTGMDNKEVAEILIQLATSSDIELHQGDKGEVLISLPDLKENHSGR